MVYSAITVNFSGVFARILGHKEREMSPAALRVVEGSAPMEKSKALDAALSQIERAFGKGSIMRLRKHHKSMEIEVVSTGSLRLDIALRVRGLPPRRVI